MTGTDTDYRERLAAEAKRVRDSGDLGRSEPLIRLFDFLVERSLDGRIPREIEIAQDVFDKTHDFDGMLDASVRVYIHRLRRKLAEHYARAPGDPDWISIPLGEYRVVLASPPAADEAVEQPEPPVAPPKRSINRVWLAFLALALVNALAWIVYVDRSSGDDVAVRSNLWRPIADNKRPTLVVLGDYYIFGDAADGIVVSRLMRDFAINSREELDRYLMLNPDKVGSYVDVNLHYLPVSVGRGLRSLLPIVNAATSASGEHPGVETMSDMKPEIFKAANVVYLGFLSGLGALQDPLFRASGFKVGDNFDELIDKATGRRFKSDWGVVADGKVPQRDYGYIASMLGPTGNRILIIAGTRDPAVAQMAEIAADQEQLKAIDAKSGGGAFEALFEVRTLGNLNLGSSLVLARPIRAESIWQPERPSGAGNSSHPAN
jgi:hypothetical protein